MNGWCIDARFDVPDNAEILAFLRRAQPSAHGDVAEELVRSAAPLPDVHSWCPDPARYAFLVLHRSDFGVFGLAWGQSGLAYRLPGSRLDEAMADGGRPVPELGAGWLRFEPWTVDEPRKVTQARLARWCAVAAGG